MVLPADGFEITFEDVTVRGTSMKTHVRFEVRGLQNPKWPMRVGDKQQDQISCRGENSQFGEES